MSVTFDKKSRLAVERIDNERNFLFAIEPRHIMRMNWLLFFMIIGVVAYMFHLKDNVHNLNSEYKQIIAQIDEEHRQYNLLKAELAYLNSPHRLQVLASKYLQLNSVKPEQFVVENKSNDSLVSAKFLELSNKKSGNNKWRYKNSTSVLKNASFNKGRKGKK